MTYRVELLAEAERALEKLAVGDRRTARRIGAALRGLAIDPRPAGARSMVGGTSGRYRVRVGDYRIIYAVEDARVLVTVIRIGHRRDVYRRG